MSDPDWNIPNATIDLKVTEHLIIIDNAAHRPEAVLEAAKTWVRLFDAQPNSGLTISGGRQPRPDDLDSVWR